MKTILIPLVLLLVILAGCSGPEEKKLSFYNKAKGFLDKGDLVKAGLELKNAIQIDPRYADAHYLLGQVELRKGQFPQAFRSFTKTVELAPGNLDAQVELGKLFLMQGEKEKAQQTADLVLKADPRHTEGLLLRGGLLMGREEWSQGARLLEGLIAGGVHKPDSYLMLSMARDGLQDARGAEAALLDGALQNPASLGIQKTLADLYASGGKVDDAAARIRRMMELEPANYGYGITLAGLYWDNGRQDQARALLGKLALAHPKDEECLISLAGFYLSRRQPVEAEKVLKGGLRASPKSFRLRFALSELYQGTGRGAQAVVLLKECLELDSNPKKPELVQARNGLARSHFLRGELPQAEAYLAEVLKVSAGNIEANYLKGRIHLQKREGLAAISAFRSVINDRPKDAEGYLFLADAHLINREPNLALENLQQAERLEPDTLRVNRAFARLFFAQKKSGQGVERMERFLTRHAGDLEARIELGDLYRLAGDFGKAEAAYRAVKSRAPQSAIPYLRLGELFAQRANLAGAIAELEAVVLKPFPGNLQSALILANLQIRAGQPAKARKIYQGLIGKHPKEWQVANDYAFFLADHGNSTNDLELAWSLAKELAGQRPEDPFILDTLGWTEYRRGNYPRSLEILEKANAKLAGHQTVSYHLGMACFQSGKKEQARTLLSKALAGGDFAGRKQAGEALTRL